MPAKTTVQYTIHGVPREVDQALRRKARARHVSLNELLVEELSRAAQIPADRSFRSLKWLAGRWETDPDFERVLHEQRVIDPGW
jgi:hypothetical protein